MRLIPIKDKQPTETGDYQVTLDGKRFFRVHFDTYFGWRFLLNPEKYSWQEKATLIK